MQYSEKKLKVNLETHDVHRTATTNLFHISIQNVRGGPVSCSDMFYMAELGTDGLKWDKLKKLRDIQQERDGAIFKQVT